MSALTAARVILVPRGKLKKATFPLGYGSAPGKVFENGMACIDTANLGAVWGGSTANTLKPIGKFIESKDNSAGGATIPIGVELTRERDLEYWDSVTGAGAITIANLFQTLYIASDHELTTATSGSIYGIMWTWSPQGYPNGVGVEPLY